MENADALFRKPLEAALQSALSHIRDLERSSVATTVDLSTLRKRLQKELSDNGLPPEEVISQLTADVQGGILGSSGGRFLPG
jgi:hypothetical protein